MYAIALIVILIYLVWGFAARKQPVAGESKKLLLPFYRMALLLYKKVIIWKLPLLRSGQVKANLERLYPGESKAQIQTMFYVEKIGIMLLVLLAGTGFCTITKIQAESERKLYDNAVIKRGSYDTGDQTIIIQAIIEDSYENKFELTVPAKRLNWDEAQQLMEEFWNGLKTEILGDNPALNQVFMEMNLTEEWEPYPFEVSWQSSSPEVISKSGKVTLVTERTEVILTTRITYGEWVWEKEISVIVVPAILSEKEQVDREVREMLTASELESREEEIWTLPKLLEGKRITWNEQIEDNSFLLWGLLLGTIAGIYFLKDQDLHKRLSERKKQMQDAYPLIVSKMTLYLGAGMTLRGAYQKIAADYQANLAQGAAPHPAYDEMVYTCHELKLGMSESEAYEHLGKRSGLIQYIKFSALLSQNLKKGNSTLLARLQEETQKALRERIQMSRQAGEEAATKLLIPMVMMLLVVMILIIVPAFSSFGI